MGKRSKIAQEVFDIAEPVAEKMGFELVDCEYKKEGKDTYLRLFIDKAGGIGIDECEAFSRAVDGLIDEGTESDADFFEVSSPGFTRPLETESDYRRYIGEKADIKLFKADNGSKRFTAQIAGADDCKVLFRMDDGSECEVALSDISKATRHIDF